MDDQDQPINVLIVEDNEDDSLLVVRALKQLGPSIHYTVVETEAQYIEALSNTPDIVISDYRLPAFNGLQALELLKNQSPEVPFILVSGSIGEELAVEAMRKGASDYLLKDVSLSRLGPAVERELREVKARRAKHDAEVRARLANQALENSGEGVFIATPELTVLYVNQAYCDISGYSADQLLSKPLQGAFDDEYPGDFHQDLWSAIDNYGSFKKEFSNHRQNGERFRQLTSISAMRDDSGKVFKLIGTITDVTKVRDYEDKLDFLAHHNEMSGLPNRRLLEKCFLQKRANPDNPNHFHAVVFFDLDNFKLINDTLGHATGDELIKEIGQRAKDALRSSDMVAHLSGDEFAAIVSVKCREGAMEAANKLMTAFQEPFLSPPNQTHISVSIGIALAPEDGENLEELLHCADQAMYYSKRQGRNTINFYCKDEDQKHSNSLYVLNALHTAVNDGAFQLAYQPVIDLQSGRVESVEALIRWPNEEFGSLSPETFIPLAEKFGLICQVSDWVLEKACSQGVAWQNNQIFDGRIAVNLCARELRLPNIVDRVSRALEKTGLAPQYLALEITEGTMVSDPEKVGAVLQTFRNMGISIYIDDFGTGYSSLSYLPLLPANVLKIDKSFIEGLYQEEKNVVIATTILQMAQNLGMTVIAEGVETASQMQFLRKKGCTHAQGYYFGEPMMADAFEDFVSHANAIADLPDHNDYPA